MYFPAESIIRTSLRALFKTFFVMIGIGLGLIPLLLLIGLFSSDKEEVKRDYEVSILPNANGVRKEMGKTVPVILQIDIDGMIGIPQLDQETVRQQLIESREGTLKNDRVKGILLRINSMGGTVVDSDGIYRALKEYKEQYHTPIYAYVDGFCASGGYYIACAADTIYSSDVSLIGSVGIRLMYPFFNVSHLLQQWSIPVKTFAKGKEKDSLNPFREWKPDEGEGLEDILAYYYNVFVQLVTENRPQISQEKLVQEYGAELFPATQALNYGYVDKAGVSRRETLEALLKELNISDEKYQVVRMKKEKWFQQLFGAAEMASTGEIRHTFSLEGDRAAHLHSPLVYLSDAYG